ncbi:hypothetical protein L1887_00803 [Cichorium endivia]|nr:hypothetical protein L1887_00803 [Cichorium endivia]
MSNCARFAQTLMESGSELVYGGTENHLVLVNLKPKGIDGSRVEKVLEAVHIAANKNTVPGDVSAMVPGTLALTSRGFVEEDFAKVAYFFDLAVKLALKIKGEAKGTKLKDFVAAMESSTFQSELSKLRTDVEEYANNSAQLGKPRLRPLINLYPNLITKEDLLTPTELAPSNNFSSQELYGFEVHILLKFNVIKCYPCN